MVIIFILRWHSVIRKSVSSPMKIEELKDIVVHKIYESSIKKLLDDECLRQLSNYKKIIIDDDKSMVSLKQKKKKTN